MAHRREIGAHQSAFSLYNLSSGEIYFEDFIASYEEIRSQNKIEKISGRLKICSKSLVFVPDDVRNPMIKILYKNIENFQDGKKNSLSLTESTIFSDSKKNSDRLLLRCSSVIFMFGRTRFEPHTIDYNQRTVSFEFQYTTVEDCLAVVGQLYRSTTLPHPEQIMMIESIVQGRLKMFKFDLTQLNDLRETILLQIDVFLIRPLVQNPGICLLTNRCCYFQALNNIDEQQKIAYELSSLEKLTKRRYKFLDIACELQFRILERQKKKRRSLYFVFSDEKSCSTFYETVRSQRAVNIETEELQRMTSRWQNGVISNYDYLLFLNDRADRSFQDCSQYPVFPWVLRNYTSDKLDLNDPQSYRDLSKPIGALNIERLERLKERLQNMSLSPGQKPFLYGSFYSNPGFVVYFLCRSYPELSLCLNGGRFDHPDRLFHSMVDTWKSVLTSDSDVKELLPEFYMSSQFADPQNDDDDDDETSRQDGKFLINKFNINFGVRHDGTIVNDVELPRWAENPKDFVLKMRMALESEHVSENLNLWIDLIFGFKQNGEEAEKSDNVFHDLTYGIPKQSQLTSSIKYDEKLSLESQILEFGQVPKQLFFKAHPKRLSQVERSKMASQENLGEEIDLASINSGFEMFSDVEEEKIGEFEFDSFCRLHKTRVSSIRAHPVRSSTNLLTIGGDGFLRNYVVDKMKSESFYSVSSRSLICFQPISVRLSMNSDEFSCLAVIAGSDRTLSIFDLEKGTSIFSKIFHDDSIVGLYVSHKSLPVIVCTCSADGTAHFSSLEQILTIDKNQYVFTENFSSFDSIEIRSTISFESSCSAMDVREEQGLLAIACQDGSLHICDFQTGQILKQISMKSSIIGLAFRFDALLLATLSPDNVTLIDISTETELFKTNSISPEKSFRSIFYSSHFLIIGLSNGSCDVWNVKINKKVLTLNVNEKSPITAIQQNHGMFFFGTEDGSIFSYVFAARQAVSL